MTPYRFIGDQDTALGFRFAGVPGDIVANREDALRAFQVALSERGLIILVLTEQVAAWLEPEVTAHKLKAGQPYIATVEDVWGNRAKTRSMEQLIYEAVGVKILEQK
ncbi:MAG: V-type ATP synthase subunit F [Lentisphaeria bacterium]|nr:V-type ATP synthase subunit F [Lentisphaeria bacterium]